MMEIHNGDMKEIFKARRGPSIDLDSLFQYCSLNSSFFHSLNWQIELAFGVRCSSEHTTKSARFDITQMAERLVQNNSVTYKKGRTVKFVASDLMKEGLVKLGEDALIRFNLKEVQKNLSQDFTQEEINAQTNDLPADFFTLED
jgi:hypothetical protein